jgi:hypothetical protein
MAALLHHPPTPHTVHPSILYRAPSMTSSVSLIIISPTTIPRACPLPPVTASLAPILLLRIPPVTLMRRPQHSVVVHHLQTPFSTLRAVPPPLHQRTRSTGVCQALFTNITRTRRTRRTRQTSQTSRTRQTRQRTNITEATLFCPHPAVAPRLLRVPPLPEIRPPMQTLLPTVRLAAPMHVHRYHMHPAMSPRPILHLSLSQRQLRHT